MTISSNSFSKRTVSSGGTMSRRSPSASSNTFDRKTLTRGDQPWTGDNLTSDPFGFDNPDGAAYGIGEYGGIRHFRNRTKPTVTH